VKTLSLHQKCIIIVTLPVILAIICVACLAHLLQEAESDLKRETFAAEVMARCTDLHRMFFDAGFASFVYHTTRSERYAEQLDSLLNQIPPAQEELYKSIKPDGEAKKLMEQAMVDSRSALDLMRRIRNNAPPELGGTIDLRRFQRDGQMLNRKLFDDYMEVYSYASRIKNQYSQSTTQSRQNVVLFLTGLLVLNVLLAVALAVYFTRTITSRLNVVGDNANRFARDQELHRPLSGGDEIASLDRVFHSMVGTIVKSRQKEQELIKAKQQVMDMVAHDLRAPLTSIRMILGLASTGVLGDMTDKAKERFQSAERESERLVRLFSDLLDFDRMESGRLTLSLAPHALMPLFNSARDATAELARQKNVQLSMQEADLFVQCDGDRVVQVLVNLMSNAVKFAPAGSTVSVEAARENGNVRVRVIDCGPGVPDEMKSLVFERYRVVDSDKPKPSSESIGLGLPIARQIVLAHNGAIGIDDASKGGSVFWFTLPAAERPA
jgi:signal transduction histidine kinase